MTPEARAKRLDDDMRPARNKWGKAAYIQSINFRPRYKSGKIRPSWDELSPEAKRSWEIGKPERTS